VHATALPGRTIRDTGLRALTGLNIVAVWERGRLLPAGPDTLLSEHSVPVIVGTEEQLTELDALFVIYQHDDAPVLVIGGGKVGCAAAEALRDRNTAVTLLDRDCSLRPQLEEIADRVVVGDAANLQVVMDAGIATAPSVVLTTNDDATNIFLALYCRKLNAETHIISRITHDWNLEAIHRAGVNFALSHGSLAVKSLISLVQGRELVILGEGAELFIESVPSSLAGKRLGESGIGANTGLNVIAVRHDGVSSTNPSADIDLPRDAELVMLGTAEQRRHFVELFA
jgi:Trk K+ transport system NAD-binding subunit